MTSREFEHWWADISRRYPSLPAWLAKCFQDANDQREFLRTWVVVLGDVELADALEVNRLMQAGDLAWVGDYDADKERLPQHVRKHARRMAAERTPRNIEPSAALSPSSFPAGKILRRIIEMTDRGVDRDEAKAIALKEFPVGRPNWEPRYHCHICRDQGRVTVASNEAIQAVIADMWDKCRHREGTMRCVCRRHIPANPRHPIADYESAIDFLVNDSLYHCESEIERFREWVKSKEAEFLESKRESAFDAFNQREFSK